MADDTSGAAPRTTPTAAQEATEVLADAAEDTITQTKSTWARITEDEDVRRIARQARPFAVGVGVAVGAAVDLPLTLQVSGAYAGRKTGQLVQKLRNPKPTDNA